VVSCRQHVAQEQTGLVREVWGEESERRIGERHADQLRLPAVESATLLDPSEQLAAEATSGQADPAETAVTAVRRERCHDAIPATKTAYRGPGVDDFTDELVSHDGALVEPGLSSVPHVKVGAADRRELNPEDDVGRREELRVPRGLVAEVVNAVVDEGAQSVHPVQGGCHELALVDSNHHSQIQSLMSCHWTKGQRDES
jgi:hypothetical protein